MDRFDAMSVLLAVVEEGSLSAGARRLNAALPTVSRKVAELERRLGARLLIRTARRVELTEAGRAYVAACRRIVEQVEEAERAAAGEYASPRGELVVTAPVMLGRLHVMPVAAGFLDAHPSITLQLHLADRNLSIAQEHVHVAVRIGELADAAFVAARVGSVRRVACASPAYLARRNAPRTPADLAGHDAITVTGFADTSTWTFMEEGRPAPVDVRPRVGVNVVEGALDAALAGLGVARLLSYQVADAVRSGALVEVLGAFAPPPLPVSLVYLEQGLLPLKVRAFLDWTAPRLRERLL